MNENCSTPLSMRFHGYERAAPKDVASASASDSKAKEPSDAVARPRFLGAQIPSARHTRASFPILYLLIIVYSMINDAI